MEEIDVVRSAYTTFGGMEYPSIVFTNPGTGIIAHEVGHQWWMGIVGDDSYRTPFLDEGFAEWAALYVVNRSAAKNPSWCEPLNWPSPGTRLTNGMDYWDEFGHYGLVYEYGSCPQRPRPRARDGAVQGAPRRLRRRSLPDADHRSGDFMAAWREPPPRFLRSIRRTTSTPGASVRLLTGPLGGAHTSMSARGPRVVACSPVPDPRFRRRPALPPAVLTQMHPPVPAPLPLPRPRHCPRPACRPGRSWRGSDARSLPWGGFRLLHATGDAPQANSTSWSSVPA